MKLLKNRLVIGCICIIVAFALGFIAVPMIVDRLNNKIAIVVANAEIKEGEIITSEKLSMIKVSKGDLPYDEGSYYNYISYDIVPSALTTDNSSLFKKDGDHIFYASCDIMPYDILTINKVSDTSLYVDENLRELGSNEFAVAVTIDTIAEGIAARVMEGDIVTILIYDSDIGDAGVDQRLMYVEVLNVINSEAAEINTADSETATGIPSVVTFKVNLDQAIALAKYENNSVLHLALACRGDDIKAENLLNKQNEYLTSNSFVNMDEWYNMSSGGDSE